MKARFGGGKFNFFGAVLKRVFIGFVLFSNTGYAKINSDNDSVAQYKKLLAEQQKEFQTQRQIIAEQGKELELLKSRLDALTSQAVNRQTQHGTQLASAKNDAEPAKPTSQLPSKPVGQAPPSAAEKPRPPEIPRLSEAVGGVLTRKGNIVFEPSLYYAYTSNNRVFLDAFTFLPALAVGLIDLREVKRHSFIATLGTRYGLTDRLELEFRVPYVYRTDSQRSRPVSVGAGVDETFNATGNDIGDLELAARYQINSGIGGWPILVGNVVATAPTGRSPFDVSFVQAQGIPGATFPTELPTGAGYYSVQPSFTALYPTDPAVFFGNVSYSYNAETSTNVGNINPGDAVGFSFGMGFGINERSSYSLGYSHKHVLESELNGLAIQGSTLDIGQLLVGYSFKYSRRTTFNLSLGIGTTSDSQDVTLNFRMPMTFGLFDS
ncbi:MAG: coiled-coil domain-containing protein [Methylobacter sp.]